MQKNRANRKFAFIFGRDPLLSLAEWKTVAEVLFGKTHDHPLPIYFGEKFLITEGKTEVVKKLFSRLGGCIKYSEVFDKYPPAEVFLPQRNRMEYKIDVFGCKNIDGTKKAFRGLEGYIRKIARKEGIKLYKKNYPPIASVKRMKKKYRVFDIFCIHSNKKFGNRHGNNRNFGKFMFGVTREYYNIKENIQRYGGRPYVDEKIGTSIRLARIMINLAGVPPGGRILDPFCGLGTILHEGALLGYKMYGMDISKERVRMAKRNTEFILNGRDGVILPRISVGNAEILDEYYEADFFDAVVTEPELGPFLTDVPDKNSAISILNSLMGIYRPFFVTVSRILKTNGRLVVMLPFYGTGNSRVKPDIGALIKNTTLEPCNPLKDFGFTGFSDKYLDRAFPYRYKEPHHKLGRILALFIKTEVKSRGRK